MVLNVNINTCALFLLCILGLLMLRLYFNFLFWHFDVILLLSQIRITALNDRKAVGHSGDKACVQISTTKEALVSHSISNKEVSELPVIVLSFVFSLFLKSYLDKFYLGKFPMIVDGNVFHSFLFLNE